MVVMSGQSGYVTGPYSEIMATDSGNVRSTDSGDVTVTDSGDIRGTYSDDVTGTDGGNPGIDTTVTSLARRDRQM